MRRLSARQVLVKHTLLQNRIHHAKTAALTKFLELSAQYRIAARMPILCVNHVLGKHVLLYNRNHHSGIEAPAKLQERVVYYRITTNMRILSARHVLGKHTVLQNRNHNVDASFTIESQPKREYCGSAKCLDNIFFCRITFRMRRLSATQALVKCSLLQNHTLNAKIECQPSAQKPSFIMESQPGFEYCAPAKCLGNGFYHRISARMRIFSADQVLVKRTSLLQSHSQDATIARQPRAWKADIAIESQPGLRMSSASQVL